MLAFHLIASGLIGVNAFALSERQVPSSSGESTDIDDVCFPVNSTDFPDSKAPCNAVNRIQQLCVFGEKVREKIEGPDLNDYSAVGHLDEESPEFQRECICQSQQFDQLQGCLACYYAHDGPEQPFYEAGAVESFSSLYCAADATPSVGYPTAIAALLTYSGETVSPATTLSGTNASKTDVSLYYTPSAADSEAWDVALPTSTASEGGATETGIVDRGIAVGVLGFAALVVGL